MCASGYMQYIMNENINCYFGSECPIGYYPVNSSTCALNGASFNYYLRLDSGYQQQWIGSNLQISAIFENFDSSLRFQWSCNSVGLMINNLFSQLDPFSISTECGIVTRSISTTSLKLLIPAANLRLYTYQFKLTVTYAAVTSSKTINVPVQPQSFLSLDKANIPYDSWIVSPQFSTQSNS